MILMMLFLSIAGPLATLAARSDDGSDLRLVVVPPWKDAQAIVAAAGGHVIGPERALFAVLVRAATPSEFDAAARAAGALAVTNGATVAAICGVEA